MEMIYFTIVAVILYLVSDWILRQIEIKRGGLLPNRSVVFFIIIAILSVVSFALIQSLYPKTEPTATTENIQAEQPQQQTPKE
jgi:amino acid transporter